MDKEFTEWTEFVFRPSSVEGDVGTEVLVLRAQK